MVVVVVVVVVVVGRYKLEPVVVGRRSQSRPSSAGVALGRVERRQVGSDGLCGHQPTIQPSGNLVEESFDRAERRGGGFLSSF